MLIVSVNPYPSQVINVALGGQNCSLKLSTRTTGMFIDVYVGTTPIVTGVSLLNGVRVVRDAYLGFVGDFLVYDQQGSDDPIYSGLGTRWLLFYLEASDVVPK